MTKVLLWGNSLGVRQSIETIGPARIVGIIAAGNRPDDLPRVQQLARARFTVRKRMPFAEDPLGTQRLHQPPALRRLAAPIDAH